MKDIQQTYDSLFKSESELGEYSEHEERFRELALQVLDTVDLERVVLEMDKARMIATAIVEQFPVQLYNACITNDALPTFGRDFIEASCRPLILILCAALEQAGVQYTFGLTYKNSSVHSKVVVDEICIDFVTPDTLTIEDGIIKNASSVLNVRFLEASRANFTFIAPTGTSLRELIRASDAYYLLINTQNLYNNTRGENPLASKVRGLFESVMRICSATILFQYQGLKNEYYDVFRILLDEEL